MKSLIPWQRDKKHAAPVRMNDWFDRWAEDPFENFFPSPPSTFSARVPSVDVTEDKKEINVRAEIPAFSP